MMANKFHSSKQSKGKKPGEFLASKKKNQDKQQIFDKINKVVVDLWEKHSSSNKEEIGSFVIEDKEYVVSTTPTNQYDASYEAWVLLKNKGYCHVQVYTAGDGYMTSMSTNEKWEVHVTGINSILKNNKLIYVKEVKPYDKPRD